jgi:hypothetical protein
LAPNLLHQNNSALLAQLGSSVTHVSEQSLLQRGTHGLEILSLLWIEWLTTGRYVGASVEKQLDHFDVAVGAGDFNN